VLESSKCIGSVGRVLIILSIGTKVKRLLYTKTLSLRELILYSNAYRIDLRSLLYYLNIVPTIPYKIVV